MDALAKLGIDGWGLLLYLVNFGVLLVLMQRFVYKPLMKYLDQRRKQIKTDVKKAQKMRTSLEAERETEASARAARQAELDQQIAAAKKMARDQAKDLINEADGQRDAILAQASAQANETIANTMKEAEDEILQRMKKVVLQVLEDGVPEEVAQESVKKSWASISKS